MRGLLCAYAGSAIRPLSSASVAVGQRRLQGFYKKKLDTNQDTHCIKIGVQLCEDRTIEMFLRFRCLDLNTRHNHSTSLRFCFQGCLQRHLDFGAADKDHLYFLF